MIIVKGFSLVLVLIDVFHAFSTLSFFVKLIEYIDKVK